MQASLGPGFEVLNLGVPGHNMPQHLDLVRREVLALHPDFVLLQWFVNDVEGDTAPRPAYAPLLPFSGLHNRLEDDSAFYTLLNSWWTREQIKLQSKQSYPTYLQTAYGDPQSAAARADELATRTLLGTLRSAHIGIGVVLFPDSGYDLGPSYPFEFLHSRMLAICEDEHVEVLQAQQWLHEFYASPEGLQRPNGLWRDDRKQPDFEAISTWVFDVYLTARVSGASEEDARHTVEEAIRGSDEWKRVHAPK